MTLDPQRREQLVQELVRRATALHMVAPAILFLEMHKPLAFTGAQMLWIAQPLLSPWLTGTAVRDLALLLEDPASVEQLIKHLEAARPA